MRQRQCHALQGMLRRELVVWLNRAWNTDMTRETRLLLSLDEIIGLRWQCNKCHAAISYRLDQTITFPQKCPSCNESLVEPQSHDDFQQMQAFADALKATFGALRAKRLGATLRLEMTTPSE